MKTMMKRMAQLAALGSVALWSLGASAGPSATAKLGGSNNKIDEGVKVQAFGTNLRVVEISGLTFAPGGAAHPTKTLSLRTIDTHTDEPITLRDMFGSTRKGPGRAAITAIAKQSREALKKELGEGYTRGMVPRLSGSFANFGYSPQGLRVGYNQFPSVIGPRVVTIPWKKLPQRQVRQYNGL